MRLAAIRGGSFAIAGPGLNDAATGSTGRAAGSEQATASVSDSVFAYGGMRLLQPAMVTASAPMISVLMHSPMELESGWQFLPRHPVCAGPLSLVQNC